MYLSFFVFFTLQQYAYLVTKSSPSNYLKDKYALSTCGLSQLLYYLPVVLKLTLYPPVVYSVSFPLSTSLSSSLKTQ
jgi:hypothetical protein